MFGIGSNRPHVPRRFLATRWWTAGVVFVLLLVVFGVVGWYWSREPDRFLVGDDSEPAPEVTGYRTVDTLIRSIDWMLDKPGGYLTNDVTPPGLWLDNMPSFEFGVLVQARDLARVLRNDYGRSQSISAEDADLAFADSTLNFTNDSWIFPPTESRYREAADALRAYRARLVDTNRTDGQFFARADNLREWLAVVERRLGSQSQRLSASVGRTRINIDLAGEPAGEESRSQGRLVEIKTPWLEIDDVFFEARGTAWALLQFMAAARVDFQGVLEDKNAVVSVEQIMRELEGALEPIASPMILNGDGYGFFANHSLVLANYLSRAHAAVIDLRELLAQG
jgi:hypothetical protein